MNPISCFKDECFEVIDYPLDKTGILRLVAKLAKKSSVLNKFTEEEIFTALLDREAVASTGLENGVALPHCRFENLNEFVVGALVSRNGLEFAAFDGKKTNLFIFIIAPESKREKHIRLLSAISRIVNDPRTRNNLLASSKSDDFIRVLASRSPFPEKASFRKRGIFHVAVYQEEKFRDILEAVSSLNIRAIVLEGRGVETYFQELPLFATFWTEHEESRQRIITGVIRLELVNELARRVNVAAGENEQNYVLSIIEANVITPFSTSTQKDSQ